MDRLKTNFHQETGLFYRFLLTGFIPSLIFLGSCREDNSNTVNPVLIAPEKIICPNGEGYVTHETRGWMFHDTHIEQGEPGESILDSYSEAISTCTSEELRSK